MDFIRENEVDQKTKEKQSLKFRQAGLEKDLKEQLENEMKEKYHFKYITENINSALKVARIEKLKQNKEKKKK